MGVGVYPGSGLATSRKQKDKMEKKNPHTKAHQDSPLFLPPFWFRFGRFAVGAPNEAVEKVCFEKALSGSRPSSSATAQIFLSIGFVLFHELSLVMIGLYHYSCAPSYANPGA